MKRKSSEAKFEIRAIRPGGEIELLDIHPTYGMEIKLGEFVVRVRRVDGKIYINSLSPMLVEPVASNAINVIERD